MNQKPSNYDKRLYKITDYEAVAKTRYFRHAHDYFNSGANDEVSLRQQYDAFKDIKLKKRTFVDPSKWKGMDTEMMGKAIKSPICMTSTAFQKMAHPDGECATARACEKMNQTPVVMSSWATTANEEFGINAPNCTKIFQIYLSKAKEVNIDIWSRVKKSGFTALAMTTDTQLLGKRLNDTRTKFSLPSHLKMENMAKYMEQGEQTAVKGGKESGLAEYVKNSKDNEIDWSIVQFVKKHAQLPVYAKGIMCAEDARLALDAGIDGIYVSNHGSRQLDTTPATIEILREVVEEVAKYSAEKGTKKVPVWFDGGIRYGSDVLKALALGADIVWIGRPVLWALACEGQTGVENIIRILNEELKEAMLQCGCYSFEDIKKNNIIYDDKDLMFARL